MVVGSCFIVFKSVNRYAIHGELILKVRIDVILAKSYIAIGSMIIM